MELIKSSIMSSNRWSRRPQRQTEGLAHYFTLIERYRLRWKLALGFWPPRGGCESRYLTAKPKPPSLTIGNRIIWVCVGVLVIGSTGCSRDAQHAEDTGKKINLTLPEPQVRVQTLQKPAEMIEKSTEKNEVKKKVESASATAQRGVTPPITSQPDVAPVNGVRMKKQASRTPAKKREATAINQQRRSDAVGDGVDPKVQASRPREGTKLYQDSDNPLHASHRKN